LHALREEPKPVYGWHVDGGDIAPYFFYPGIAYCLALLRALLESGEVSRDEIAALEKTRDVLGGHLAPMIEGDALCCPEADTPFLGQAKVYANPLGGLGLLSVAR